jgi:predicted glycosyltransferase involved in capsule biosynthesis
MSVAINKFRYRLPYIAYFGGVSALTEEQFLKVNGFSNVLFGWGGEDDDMYNRVIHRGYSISRYSETIGRYKMLKHRASEPNTERYNKLFSSEKRLKTDGINSVVYKRLDLVLKKLFTWILVDI